MLLFMDGIDRYGTTVAKMLNGLWAACTGAIQSSVIPPNTSYALLLTGSAQYCRRVLPTTAATVGMGARFYTASLPSFIAQSVLTFADASANAHIRVAIGISGEVHVYRGATAMSGTGALGTLLGSSAVGVIIPGTWQHIECKVFVHDSTGTVEVKIEGVTVLTITGADTCNGSTATISNIGSEVKSGGTSLYIRDYFAWETTGPDNDDFIGVKRVYTCMPTADGSLTAWTRNTGSDDYAAIDEVPDTDTTDYVYSDTAGQVSTFTVADLPANVGGIVGVEVTAKMSKSDAGVATGKAGVVYLGLVDAGDEHVPGTSFAFYPTMFEADPYGVAWARTVFNATEMRLERVT